MKVNKKMITIGIIAISILLICTLILFFLSPKNKLNNTKKVEGLVITDADITFDGSISVSFLSVNVKNSSKKDKEDVKLKITFLDKSRKEITSVTGFLGNINVAETRELNAAVSKELKNVFDIKYEIVK